MRYLVQELSAHKWYTVRSFDTKEEAEDFARKLGSVKIRVKQA
jgi:hypothetical protein